jgi:hypothetical protein
MAPERAKDLAEAVVQDDAADAFCQEPAVHTLQDSTPDVPLACPECPWSAVSARAQPNITTCRAGGTCEASRGRLVGLEMAQWTTVADGAAIEGGEGAWYTRSTD